jgi:hypothetical protein
LPPAERANRMCEAKPGEEVDQAAAVHLGAAPCRTGVLAQVTDAARWPVLAGACGAEPVW